jgi:hypothetical protein
MLQDSEIKVEMRGTDVLNVFQKYKVAPRYEEFNPFGKRIPRATGSPTFLSSNYDFKICERMTSR